ncbi:MAG TPA: PP2C family protein-serine/threonine phosphatase [Thermoanaerobaculia bacterium]|nr:PP2C family protein-serine/threonine phosphatase [Thermoanaerobaculia bacterium]
MNRIAILILALLCCSCVRPRDVARLDGTIPSSPRYTHLVFRAFVDELTVSIDGRRVYAFRDADSNGRLTVHVLTLPPDSAGKRVVFDVPDPPRQDTLIGGRYLATAETLPFAIDHATAFPVREDSDDIVLGFIFFVTGAIACVAALIRRRDDTLAIGSFGAFTLLYGLRLVVDSSVPYVFGVSSRSLAFAEAFITYIIPIAGWAMPLRLIGRGWKSSLRLQVIAFAIFAPIGIISDVITRTPSSLEAINNVLVVVGGINIIVNLLVAEHRRTLELRVLLAGSVVFMLFALNNNLTNLGLLPWDYDAEAPGFVLFVAALGFAATRAFTRGERESMAIDNELRTAREIQQSILPRAMPQRSGLRFDAAYLPATSVGGDMYNFLERDDGAGVLVADVAGHGVPAALIASMVKIAVSTQARIADDPAAVIGELNAILRRDVRRAFVTATYLWLDVEQRRVLACNAGHPPPLLYRDGAFVELGGAGVLLGRFADARYTATATQLQDGDRIVAYTDGIPEARNARGEMFGEERLRELVRSGASAQSVVEAVRAWRGEAAEDADDLTVVIVEVSGAPASGAPVLETRA